LPLARRDQPRQHDPQRRAPTLERDLDASASQLQWIVDSYMLVFAGLLLTAGALGDRFGRRGSLTAACVVFGPGSALAALADSSGELIAARALMGVGGPRSCPRRCPSSPPSSRARAREGHRRLGRGLRTRHRDRPVLGGWLIEHWDWSAIFLVNLPVVALAIAGNRASCPNPAIRRAAPGSPRLRLSIAGLTALVWAIIEAPARGWTDPRSWAAFAAATAVLAVFVAWELRAPRPCSTCAVPQSPLLGRQRRDLAAVLLALGTVFLVTQYLQSVLGYTALEAGIRSLPVALGLMIAAPAVGQAPARARNQAHGGRRPPRRRRRLALLTQADAAAGYGILAVAQLAIGFGVGTALAPATDSIMGSLPLAKASVGSAVNDTTRLTGGALGVAVIGRSSRAGTVTTWRP
jgi:MFS family permease